MSGDQTDSYEGWPAARKAIAYSEARRVLDAQRETLGDIDDKALRTVRVTTVVFGVFVATARIAGPDAFHPLASRSERCLSVLLGHQRRCNVQ